MRWSNGGKTAAMVGVGIMALMGGPAVQATVPTSPSGGPGDFSGPARMSIRGAAASETASGDYGLGVWARTTGEPEDAQGQLRFGHRGTDGKKGLAGEVHCLSRDAAGLVQLSGTIFGSGGEDAAGKDFAVTVDADGSPQRFSDLRLGDPGTIAACSGGAPEFHPVTRGGYDASSEERQPGT